MSANSSQLEQVKYIYGCRSKQYIASFSKIISIKKHFLINKNLYGSRIEHKPIYVSFTGSTDSLTCMTYHMLKNKDMRVDNSQKSNVLHVNILYKPLFFFFFLKNIFSKYQTDIQQVFNPKSYLRI